MDDQPFTVSLLLDKQCYALALIDSGCSSYGLINSRLASKQSFERIPITPRPISGFSPSVRSQITEVAKLEVDLDGYKEEAFFYIVPNLAYDIILGLPWMKRNNVRLAAKQDTLTLGAGDLKV